MGVRELVRNALRMRPDRIVVGEVRGGEAMDMLQAMNTGHTGSLTTLHANLPRDAISRLETMAMMAGLDMPLLAIRKQIAAAVNLIVHLATPFGWFTENDPYHRTFRDGRGSGYIDRHFQIRPDRHFPGRKDYRTNPSDRDAPTVQSQARSLRI